MPKKEFVMRGQTANNTRDILNFSGYKPGYAYRLVELTIYPSTAIGGANGELLVTITAAKTYMDPANPDFSNAGLIATAMLGVRSDYNNGTFENVVVVNDTFLITQDLILAASDTLGGSAVNWQCRFVAEKMSGPEAAVANYKQFTISD